MITAMCSRCSLLRPRLSADLFFFNKEIAAKTSVGSTVLVVAGSEDKAASKALSSAVQPAASQGVHAELKARPAMSCDRVKPSNDSGR